MRHKWEIVVTIESEHLFTLSEIEHMVGCDSFWRGECEEEPARSLYTHWLQPKIVTPATLSSQECACEECKQEKEEL